MIKLKFRKFGRSLGVALPKEVIERLQTAEGKHLLLTESADGTFQLAPSDAEFELKMKIAREGMDRYHNTSRILAK
jgi:putative addiction module antidote